MEGSRNFISEEALERLIRENNDADNSGFGRPLRVLRLPSTLILDVPAVPSVEELANIDTL